MVKFLGLLLRKIRLFYSFKINMSYGYIFKTKLFIKLTLKINIFESEKHNIIIIILIIVKKCDFLLYNHSLQRHKKQLYLNVFKTLTYFKILKIMCTYVLAVLWPSNSTFLVFQPAIAASLLLHTAKNDQLLILLIFSKFFAWSVFKLKLKFRHSLWLQKLPRGYLHIILRTS